MIGVDQGETILFSAFEDDGEMWTGQGARESRTDIRFAQPFAAPPVVHLSPAMWDISNAGNARFDLHAVAIGSDGFSISFKTWGDTQVARVRVAWLALGPLADDDNWDV